MIAVNSEHVGYATFIIRLSLSLISHCKNIRATLTQLSVEALSAHILVKYFMHQLHAKT